MTTETVSAEDLARFGVDVVPEIIWDDIEILRPGVDYRDGVTYFTIAAKVNLPVTKGRGDKATTTLVLTDHLVAVTSDGRQFPYDAERVGELGYGFPNHVMLPNERRWSQESIRAFLKGNETIPDPVTLHGGLRNVYEEYVEFAKPEYYDILPLFIMGSYLFRLFDAVGYIHFNGTAASGKSQNLSIIKALAFNPVWAASMSASALYRQIAGMPGTVLIDEAEGFDGERGEELRRILNAGYLDGSTVIRTERGKNDVFQNVHFESFGPKVIAGIAPLDSVIGSRCLIVAMRPALRTIQTFSHKDNRWQRLRDRLYLWAMYHMDGVAETIAEWRDYKAEQRAPALRSRQWQITQMYVVLADYLDKQDGGDRADRLIQFFNDYFSDLQRQQDATDRIRIVLRSLPRVLERHAPHEGGWFYLKTIHEVVSDYLEEDAKEYFKTRTVSKHLDVLGFRKKRAHKQGSQIWVEPEAVRQELRQRQVEPYPEDAAWLAGEVEYTHYEEPEPEPELNTRLLWADAPEAAE